MVSSSALPVLEDGTPVKLRISQTVSSADAHVDDKVEFEVLEEVRIPDDADQRSGLMPITHSGRCRSVIPGGADHSFRGDPDQLIAIAGRVIAMPRNVFHRAK